MSSDLSCFSNSISLFERGAVSMPGGVSSPGRIFREVDTPTLVIDHASGSQIVDVDGNIYVDFINGLGPMILGHAHEQVADAIAAQVRRGSVYGACCRLEYELSRAIVQSTPAVQQVRFTCSGTEAVMSALRLARGYTGRDLILKFEGGYHGHSDSTLAKAAKPHMRGGAAGVRTGLSERVANEVLTVPYNDLDAVETIFQQHGSELAAAIVEPVATNMGLVPGTEAFLTGLRALCDEYGAVLIFDEVVSGFRLCYGAASNMLGVRPDLTTFGKIIGGGTPVGAYGGRADIMALVAQQGGVFQGGTFAGNPLTMAAGLATLEVLANEEIYDKLDRLGSCYEQTTVELFRRQGLPFTIVRRGSLLSYVLVPGLAQCRNFADVARQDRALFQRLHLHLTTEGYLLPPTIEEPIFISAAHTIEQVTDCARLAAEWIASVMSEAPQFA